MKRVKDGDANAIHYDLKSFLLLNYGIYFVIYLSRAGTITSSAAAQLLCVSYVYKVMITIHTANKHWLRAWPIANIIWTPLDTYNYLNHDTEHRQIQITALRLSLIRLTDVIT